MRSNQRFFSEPFEVMMSLTWRTLFVEEEMDEPGDLQVGDGGLRVAVRRDDQVRSVQLQVPGRDPVDAASCEDGIRDFRCAVLPGRKPAGQRTKGTRRHS
jgi:hypothetical protein